MPSPSSYATNLRLRAETLSALIVAVLLLTHSALAFAAWPSSNTLLLTNGVSSIAGSAFGALTPRALHAGHTIIDELGAASLAFTQSN